MHHDPYDVRIAFDDVYGTDVMPDYGTHAPDFGVPPMLLGNRCDVAETTSAITDLAKHLIRRRNSEKSVALPVKIQAIGCDETAHTFACVGLGPDPVFDTSHLENLLERGYISDMQIIGNDGSDVPIFSALRQKFSDSAPPPTAVRLDTEDTYRAFRDARRAPYTATLEERLANLEGAASGGLAEHLMFRSRLDDLENALARHAELDDRRMSSLESRFLRHTHGGGPRVDVIGALEEATLGGQRVPLPLPDWARGKVECWQDGHEVLCTIRMRGPNGDVRLATTGAPVTDEVIGLVSHAMDAGAPPDLIVVVVPILATVMTGAGLLPRLCQAAPDLAARPEATVEGSFVGALVPQSDPDMAAAMALCQRAQQGDRNALTEIAKLHLVHGRTKLFYDAGHRLVDAQRTKARRAA